MLHFRRAKSYKSRSQILGKVKVLKKLKSLSLKTFINGRFLTIIIVIFSMGLAAIITYIILKKQLTTETPLLPPAKNLNLPEGVAALGYLEPEGEVIKLSAPAFMEGAKVEQLLVKRGDSVKKGQIIAILNNSDRLAALLEEAKTNVKVAKARLEQVKAGAKQGEINAQKAKFQTTEAELEGQIATQKANIATLKYDLEGETASQKAIIERIEAQLKNAQTECDRYESLYQDGAVSASQRDNICLTQKTVEKQLKEAQASLNRIMTTKQEQINQATANLKRTIATVSRQINQEKENFKAVAQVRPEDIMLANANLEAAQKAVKTAQANLDLSYVKSPQDGQVIKIHTWPGEIVSNNGIVSLGNTKQMYVTAEVYETDISRIKLGQLATIKVEGIVDDFQGKVDEIGLQISAKNVLGTDPVADADARVVEVKIRLTPEDSMKVAGLTNLQVNVIINTAK